MSVDLETKKMKKVKKTLAALALAVALTWWQSASRKCSTVLQLPSAHGQNCSSVKSNYPGIIHAGV